MKLREICLQFPLNSFGLDITVTLASYEELESISPSRFSENIPVELVPPLRIWQTSLLQRSRPEVFFVGRFLTTNSVHLGSSRCGTAKTNQTRKHEVAASIPGLTQWVRDLALP